MLITEERLYFTGKIDHLPKVSTDPVLQPLAKAKRTTLFSRIALFASIVAFLHALADSFDGLRAAPFIDLSISLVLFACYLLNKKGRTYAGRITGLTFLNIIFALYASVVPFEVGIFLFYFPLIAISSAIFASSDKIIRISFIALSLSLLIALFATDFHLLGDYRIDSSHESMFFVINLFSSFIMLVMCIQFILQVNEESERALHRLAEEIKVKNADLEKTNSELDRFLYSTSHDLRSPLASIKGLVNVATQETKDPTMHSYFSMITDRANKLDGFVKDIIDYSRNTRTEVTPEPIDFDHLIDEVKNNFLFMEGAQEIRVEKDISIDREVKLDKGRVTVVLNNIFSNAIKYHNLRSGDPWIRISVQTTPVSITIVIADNGKGIADNHLQRIFEMFYRGTEESKGSGLGLYIVKETVEKMNGNVSVESALNKGTSFFISLPLS